MAKHGDIKMSDIAALEIKLKADVSNVIAGVSQVTKNLTATSNAVNKSAKAFEALNTGANQASNAMLNLGRVVQDAPYGFIGIANNINPLLESFQRLQKETGSTGGSFKALIKELSGGAGIGLAVSVVTSLLVTFGDKLFEAKKSVDEFAKAEKDASDNAAGEIANLRVLEKVATDLNAPFKARLKAVHELQAQYPSYLKNLSDEAVLSGEAAKQINEIAKALAVKAQYEAASTRLTDLASKQLDAKKEELALTGQLRQAELDLAKAKLSDSQRRPVIGGSTVAVNTAGITESETEKVKARLAEINKALEANRKTQQGINNDFQYFLNVAENSKIGSIDLDKDGSLKKTKEKIDQVSETLRTLAADRDHLNKQPLIKDTDKLSQEIQLIEGAIKRLVDLNVSPNSTIIQKLIGEDNSLKFRDNLLKLANSEVLSIPLKVKPLIEIDSFNAKGVFGTPENLKSLMQLEKAAQSLAVKVPIDFYFNSKSQASLKQAVKGAEEVSESIKNIFSNAFVEIGESLGELFAGSQNPFAGLYHLLGEGLKRIGTLMIEMAPLMKALKTALNSLNPALLLPAGIGLVGLGSFIESKIPKFAEGGIVNQPTYGLFGERGPEAIMPLSRLKDMVGGGMGGNDLLVEHKIKGEDLVILINRTNRKLHRTY